MFLDRFKILERFTNFYRFKINDLFTIRSILIPILLSVGILIYYSLSFEPTWFQLLFLSPALLIAHYIRKELAYILAIILLGALAFKTRVVFVNYKPSQLTSATIQLQAKILDVRMKEYNSKNNDENGYIESFKILISELIHIQKDNQLNYTQVLPHKALLSIEKDFLGNAKAGDIVHFTARLMPVSLPLIPNGYDARFYSFFENIGSAGIVTNPLNPLHSEGLPLRVFIRNLITNKMHDQSDFILATILGEKTAFKKDTLDIFAKIGLGHVLAISGLHIGIMAFIGFFIGKSLMWLLGFVYKPSWSHMLTGAKLISLLFVLSYLLISGIGFSALRASLMFIIGLVLFYIQRHTQLIFTLTTTASIILLLFPESLFYASFQLSVIAVFSFCFIKYKKEDGIISKVKQLGLITLLINLLTLPLVLYHFDTVALQPFLANMLLLPYISGVLIPTTLIWFLQQLILPLDLLGWLLKYMVLFLKTAASYLEIFAIEAKTPSVNAAFICAYGLTIPFLVTSLRSISFIGIGVFIIGLFITPSKPILLADNYGRVGFVKDEVLYVTWDPSDDKFLEKVWKDYWQVKTVRRFNDKQTPFIKLFENRKTANVLWELDGRKLAWCSRVCKVDDVFLGFGKVAKAEYMLNFGKLSYDGGVALYPNGELVNYQPISSRPWFTRYNVLRIL